jgi:hypothetical protein
MPGRHRRIEATRGVGKMKDMQRTGPRSGPVKKNTTRSLVIGVLFLIFLPVFAVSYLWIDAFIRTHSGPFRNLPAGLKSWKDLDAALSVSEDTIRQSMGDARQAADRLKEMGYQCEATSDEYVRFLLHSSKVVTNPDPASGTTCRYKLDLTGNEILANIVADQPGRIILFRTGKNFPYAY